MKQNCCVIYNPTTASFNPKELDKSAHVLAEKYDVIMRRSEYKSHVVDLVQELNEETDLIITYGGDGTFSEAVKSILSVGQKALLSHIPAGTTNDLKRNFKLRANPQESARLIINGEEQQIDIFSVNNNPFSYVAAWGFLANAPCNTPAELKKYLGHLSYLVIGFKEFLDKPPVYNINCVTDNGEYQLDCITGIITNAIGFGGMKLFKDVNINDEYAELTLIKPIDKKEMLHIARDIILKRFNIKNYQEQAIHIKAKSAKITFADNIPEDYFDLDGEKLDVLTGTQELLLEPSQKLQLILPKR